MLLELILAGSSIWGSASTDQERCQAEADYLAKTYIPGERGIDHVGETIGKFEGIGRGYGDSPSTCTPDSRLGYELTGDATAKCERGGMTIRVRSWR